MRTVVRRGCRVLGFSGDLVDPTGAESNRLFEVFQEWEHHLAPYDLTDLRCGDEHLR